jgi:dsRNA-specific ribonuclease
MREAWFYRDWVIDSLNRDKPYDRFIIEQIAGDLLPECRRQEQLVATGFLRNSMINEEGGIDPEQFRMEAMFDRMDAIGKSILGLTINCAQCHTHKYDPIKHDEYYRMMASSQQLARGQHRRLHAVGGDEAGRTF